jgi:quercetin dioxygenase-like cupin family protein
MTEKTAIHQPGSEAEILAVLGTQVKFLCTGDDTGSGFSLLEVALPEGSGAPPHHHPWDEAYYLLAGEVAFQLDDRTIAMTAGDFIYAPGGMVHSFTGASAQPARMLVFDSPAHSEAFFRALDREVKDIPDDLAKVADIGKRHKLTFL